MAREGADLEGEARLIDAMAERMRRLAVDPGSLTALDVRPDGEVLVAFTNRT